MIERYIFFNIADIVYIEISEQTKVSENICLGASYYPSDHQTQ